jgi:hypothetical protein
MVNHFIKILFYPNGPGPLHLNRQPTTVRLSAPPDNLLFSLPAPHVSGGGGGIPQISPCVPPLLRLAAALAGFQTAPRCQPTDKLTPATFPFTLPGLPFGVCRAASTLLPPAATAATMLGPSSVPTSPPCHPPRHVGAPTMHHLACALLPHGHICVNPGQLSPGQPHATSCATPRVPHTCWAPLPFCSVRVHMMQPSTRRCAGCPVAPFCNHSRL